MLRVATGLIATLAVLLIGGMSSAGAHQPSVESFVPPPLPGPELLERFEVLRAAGDRGSTEVAWAFALTVVLAAAALTRGRSPRLVVAALAVVLAVFAVESAEHSVHHGPDAQPVACPTALVAAHLNGATVETLALEVPIALIGMRLDTFEPRVLFLRSLDPQHGRAPPSALV